MFTKNFTLTPRFAVDTGEITIKVLFNISVRRKQHNGLQKDTCVFEWSVYENKDLVKCDIYSKTDPLI